MCNRPDDCARGGLANVVRAGIVQATVSKGARVHSIAPPALQAWRRRNVRTLAHNTLVLLERYNGCRALQGAETLWDAREAATSGRERRPLRR